MKKYVILLTTCFILSFIYFYFIYIIFGFLTPNLIVIFPIAFMYKDKKNLAFFLAFTLGIFADLFTGSYLGLTSIFLLTLIEAYYYLKLRIGYLNLVTLSTAILGVLFYDQLVQRVVYENAFNWWHSLTQSIITALFVFIVIKFLTFIPANYWPKDPHAVK